MRNTLAFTNQYVETERGASRNRHLPIIELLFFVALIFYYLLPSFNAMIPFVPLIIVCVAYTVTLCLLHPKEMDFFISLMIMAIIITLMYYILTDTSTVSVGVSNYAIKRLLSKFQQVFMSFFPLLMFYRITSLANSKQKIFVLLLMAGLLLYVVANTMIELMTNEHATRSWGDFDEQNKKNVGTYAYVYAIPIVLSFLPYLSSVARKKGSVYKILVIGIEVFLFVFLLFAQYTLALLIAIIILTMQILSNIKNTTNKALLWGLVLLTIILSPIILNFLATNVPSEQMATRLREIAAFFSTGAASGDNLGGRLELYWKTIEAFFRSPFFGNRKLSFDGHSTFLSVFADIGIFGGVCFISIYASAKKVMGEMLTKKQALLFKPAFFGLILMGLTNPIHSADPLAATVWLFIPLMIIVFGEKKENETSLGN